VETQYGDLSLGLICQGFNAMLAKN
jgi:hypothetical protein